MGLRAVLDHLEKRKISNRCRDLNRDFLVFHPVAWSLYRLSCRVRACVHLITDCLADIELLGATFSVG